jgi:hypothetical protein
MNGILSTTELEEEAEDIVQKSRQKWNIYWKAIHNKQCLGITTAL